MSALSLIHWIVVHGRSQLVESLVWLTPSSVCKENRQERSERREDDREERFEKNPLRTNYSFESSESVPCFQIIYMIRIRFFGTRELIQN